MSRTILGQDPSTTGYGIALVDFPVDSRPVVLFHCVIRPNCDDRALRLGMIGVDIEDILKAHALPVLAAFEGGFVGKGSQVSLAIAEARGVGMSVCARFGIQVEMVSPRAGKMAATGSGNAQKGDVIEWVAALCDLPDGMDFLPEDASDAAAIAISAAIARGWWTRPIATKARRRKRATSVDAFLRLATGGMG